MIYSRSTIPVGTVVCAVLAACASTPQARPIHDLPYERANSHRLVAKTSLVSFPVQYGGNTWQTAGLLNVPYSVTGRGPAVLIVHGSGGVDSRGAHYAAALNRAGFVTLEIDLWAPRGVQTAAERPKSVRETLPDAFAALHFLSQSGNSVDPARIGIMGFSWGGVVSMLAATAPNRSTFASGAERFAAHAPFYPVCWVYNRAPGYEFRELSGAPVLIQAGDADTYDSPGRCAGLRASLAPADQDLVSLKVYHGATHAWERREPDALINDPYAHDGAGGEVPMRYDEATTRASTEAVVAFFGKSLAGGTDQRRP